MASRLRLVLGRLLGRKPKPAPVDDDILLDTDKPVKRTGGGYGSGSF